MAGWVAGRVIASRDVLQLAVSTAPSPTPRAQAAQVSLLLAAASPPPLLSPSLTAPIPCTLHGTDRAGPDGPTAVRGGSVSWRTARAAAGPARPAALVLCMPFISPPALSLHLTPVHPVTSNNASHRQFRLVPCLFAPQPPQYRDFTMDDSPTSTEDVSKLDDSPTSTEDVSKLDMSKLTIQVEKLSNDLDEAISANVKLQFKIKDLERELATTQKKLKNLDDGQKTGQSRLGERIRELEAETKALQTSLINSDRGARGRQRHRASQSARAEVGGVETLLALVQQSNLLKEANKNLTDQVRKLLWRTSVGSESDEEELPETPPDSPSGPGKQRKRVRS